MHSLLHLKVFGATEMSCCVRLFASLLVPKDKIYQSGALAAVHMRVKRLAIPVLVKVLEISSHSNAPARLDLLLPTNNGE